MKTLDEINEILEKNDLYSEAINGNVLCGMHVVTIYIDGDWKHDHGFLNYLMKENGYEFVGYESIIDTGSDWYPATHKFVDAEHLDFFNACARMFAA